MKYEERRPYLDQVEAEYAAYVLREQTGHQILCSWCRYFYSSHDYEYGPEADCTHPIEKIRESTAAFEGGDCWGFRVMRGASERLIRSSDGPPHRVGRPRLVELVEMGPERRQELIEGVWNAAAVEIGRADLVGPRAG